MTASKAHIAATTRYEAKAYDRIALRLRKDGIINGDSIQTHAAGRGESLNGFIVRAISEAVKRDGQAIEGNSHREAWSEFFSAVDASNEEVPNFERVSFSREVEL